MTTIAENTISPALLAAANGNKTKAAGTDSPEVAQDRFLKLLVTQMKNQDPLNPMDNAQVTSQLAQLSTVTGIDKLNTTLEALKGNYQASQSLQAAALIGHGVLLPGSSTTLAEGKAMFGIDITEAADNVTVTVRDGAGKAVHTMDLGRQEPGVVPLGWDGKTDSGTTAIDGAYTVTVAATRAGEKTAAEALSFGQIGSVSSNAQGVKINVPNIGAVDIAAVRQFM